jgi:hypothetical protein
VSIKHDNEIWAVPEIILWGQSGIHLFVLRVEGSAQLYVLGMVGVRRLGGGCTPGVSWGWGREFSMSRGWREGGG